MPHEELPDKYTMTPENYFLVASEGVSEGNMKKRTLKIFSLVVSEDMRTERSRKNTKLETPDSSSYQ
ncbi:Protein of unknown function [Gryllus bimaculatus]|nr:Protein of unknown function [Gryllus bimaculatus]